MMAVVAVISYYASKQTNPITGRTQAIALNPKQEVALGLRAAPQMARQFGGEDRDAAAQALVDEVGRKLVSSTAAASTPYKFEFTVLADAKTVNAFALPGGPIFITRALYNQLENEAQLAGVLGHEVGHVVGRHSAEKIARSEFGKQIVGAIGVATSDDRGGGIGQMGAAVVNKMMQLSYGREDELQSDSLGVRFMAEPGYDPHGLINVMEILARSSGGKRKSEFMSSHPDPGNRSVEIQKEIAKRFPQGVPSNLTLGRPLGPSRRATSPS
jgi:predicted Zn-dependent protease